LFTTNVESTNTSGRLIRGTNEPADSMKGNTEGKAADKGQ
jgi:hypothetical protein